MSIEIGGITYEEPTDKPVATVSQVDYLLACVNDEMKRVLKTAYSEAGHNHDEEVIRPKTLLAPLTTKYVRMQGNDAHCTVYKSDSTYHPGAIDLHCQSGTGSLYCDGYYLIFSPGHSMQVFGTIFATAFTEWSEAKNKEDISDIPDSKSSINGLRPRNYSIDGRNTAGFVVEESPSEFVRETNDPDTGNVRKGVDLGAILSNLTDMVQKIDQRLSVLEGKR